MGARGRIKGLGACWVPKGWGGFDCLFPCRAKARRCAEQSEARRKFGEFDPQRCLLEYAAEYFFSEKCVYLFIKKRHIFMYNIYFGRTLLLFSAPLNSLFQAEM